MAKELTIKDIEKSNADIAKEIAQLQADRDKATEQIREAEQIIAHPESVEGVEELTKARRNKEELEDRIRVLNAKLRKVQTPENNGAVYCAVEKARAESRLLYEEGAIKHIDALKKLNNEFEIRDNFYTSLFERRRELLCNSDDGIRLPALYASSGIYNSTKNYLNNVKSHIKN